QTAETIWQAKRKCPDLRLVAPHRSEYVKFSRKCNELYLQYTDLVDPFGIDESFLDVTGSMHLFGSGEHIADELRRRMREEVGLTISVGVSFNRAFAKLGSDYKKPDGTTVFSRENFKQRVWALPANTLLMSANAPATGEPTGRTHVGELPPAIRRLSTAFWAKTAIFCCVTPEARTMSLCAHFTRNEKSNRSATA
ncbi:MAG: hypothetical protein ACLUZQ_10350, partial [Butyricicoccus sp.]